MVKLASRRSILQAALGFFAAVSARPATLAFAEAELSEEEKIAHVDAQYQASPKGQQRCSICLQFEPPDRCKIVRVPIYPDGWCQFFAARDNAH